MSEQTPSNINEQAYSFTKEINSDQLQPQVTTLCAQINVEEDTSLELLRIDTLEDTVSIVFNQALSDNGLSLLNVLMENYVLVKEYIPQEDQDQIDKLIAYLNNENPSIANAARSTMILNIAPRLGIDLITKINKDILIKLNM